MNEIKSKKASEYIHEYIPWAYMTLAIKTIQIAEQEAEERHEQQLQELRDRAVEAFRQTMFEHQVDEYVDCSILIKEFIKKLTEK